MDHRRPGVVRTHSPPGAAEHNLPEGWPTRQLVTGARRSASPTRFQAPRSRDQGETRCRTRPRHPILPGEARTTGWVGELGPGEASVGRSLRALRDGREASSGARCGTIKNDRGGGVRPRRVQRKSLQPASCEALAAAARSVRMPRDDRPCCHTVRRDPGDDAG